MNPPAERPVIQLEAVEKTYRTGEVDVHAVRGVSLKIAKGEFVAFMGASGSGKSTLMNLLGCLDQPTSGRYLLDGVNVSDLNRDALATIRNRKLGFIFQSFNLLPRTSALENVELPLLYSEKSHSSRELREKGRRALSLVGLADRAKHHPSELSGGQQPEVLLADEPTGNLDSRTSVEIMGVFQKLNDAGITVIMVTHEPDIAAYTKRTIVMRDGRVVSDLPVTRRLIADEELAKLESVPLTGEARAIA